MRQGSRASFDPLLTADAVIEISAGEGLIAVAVGDARGSRLMTAPATTKGKLELEPAEGAGQLPYWAPIHVGRDSKGDAVIAYPSCTGEAFATCKAVTWSARTNREAPVPGLDDAGGVLEVAVDRGNAAAITTQDADARQADLIEEGAPDKEVWARRGGGDARQLDVELPDAIALHGDTLATVNSTGEDVGVCGEQLARLWRIDTPAAEPRTIGSAICGLGGSRFASATLDATSARFLITNNGEDGYAELLTFDGETGKRSRGRLGANVADVAWLSRTVGIATDPPGALCTGGIIDTSAEPNPAMPACRLGRITLRAARG